MHPKIYTIAPERPFLKTLALGLFAMAEGDALALPRMRVLLPTRRAVRALREAFLSAELPGREAGTPLLLPRMNAIGDLDSDELLLSEAASESENLALPPAIPELRRRLLLTRLVLGWGESADGGRLLPGQAAALAASLARLLDAAATEGARFARLPDLVPEDLARHWQIVCRFLEILPNAWPPMLAAEGALDPAERRNRLLERQAEEWRQKPPADPVIAAGFVGGVPALTALLSVVAGLEAGAVILPGLDRFSEEEDWSEIEKDEAHPQHLMALFLKELEVAPIAVRDWPPGTAAFPRSPRNRILCEALRPPATTHKWRELAPEGAQATLGLLRFDCVSPEDEALTIALLLRRKLEEPGATAALVTPDRELARRVAEELRRWGIEIDDSAGLPLARTPPGAFLRLILEAAESDLAPVPLLALLKHPLAAGGLSPEMFRARARRLERKILGPRPAPGFRGLRAALGGEEAELGDFVERLETALLPLLDLFAADAVPLSRLVAAHIRAAERLAESDRESGAKRLWSEAAGEAAARFCHDLIEAAADFPPLPGRHYPALFGALAAGAVVRPLFGRHPRLFIWGLLEARLQQADLLVLGGLNEGTWPAAAEHDPWMSRAMRQHFGLSSPERAIGLAAHDFAQAFGAPQVALTRAARREGVPTVPSRWLLRLDAVLRALRLEIRAQETIEEAARLIDEPTEPPPRPAAPACPPLAARPRRLSVTEIETWLKDPYAIYARHVLDLKALDELDADPGRAELGTIIHGALDEFLKLYPRELPAEAEAELLRIGRECFGALLSRPGVWAFWWPRFERIVRWLVGEERSYRRGLEESLSERRGSLLLSAPGGPFTLTAKADRIDRLKEGGFAIIDYKTGLLPSKREIAAGFAPQLPLEGAILRAGGFEGLKGAPSALEYWRLGQGERAGERVRIDDGNPAVLIDDSLHRLERLIARFDDPSTPYLAVPWVRRAPRYSDYRHLERVEESGLEE